MYKDLTYDSIHTEVQYKINKAIGKRVNRSSNLEEAVRSLRCMELSSVHLVIFQTLDQCGYLLDGKTAQVFDELPALEEKLDEKANISLCHIAGYDEKNKLLSQQVWHI